MEQMNLQISQILQPTLNVQIVQNNAPVVEAKIVIGGGGTVSVVFGDTMTGTGTPSDPVNVSNDILEQIQNNSETAEENASQISNIQDIIPNTANPQNQLADQGFVNSSIQTATAYFRGDWATWADVPSDPALYPADATGNHTPITNDYMVVIADEQENGGTWRYKYTGLWSEQGKDGWLAEYQVNETPLTAAQLAALNSGITADAVASFVKNTDYAGVGGKAGVIRPQATYGVTVSPSSGVMYSNSLTLTEYQAVSTACFMSKGTLENIKDDYVKRGVTANTITLTDEEKAAAQAWLGVESGGDDYLPLSGGTLTGAIEFEWSGQYLATKNVVLKTKYYRTDTGTIESRNVLTLMPNGDAQFAQSIQSDFITPSSSGLTGQATLGNKYLFWNGVYTTKLNAGRQNNVDSGDLIVPTEGGTLARLEDLEGIGGASLPDQTGNAGKFLTTDGTTASWSDKPLVNKATETTSLAIGGEARQGYTTVVGVFAGGNSAMFSTIVGNSAESRGEFGVAVGRSAIVGIGATNAIQLGGGRNDDANTFKAANANGNFEMMDANGNVPLGRLTYVTDQIGDISTALTAILGE